MWKRFKFYAVSTVIAGLGAAVVYLWLIGPRPGAARLTVNPPAIVQEIQQLHELVTVKYGVQKVVGLKEEKVPFGSEEILIMVRAEVLGGVDLAALTPADVTVGPQQRVTIRLPPPKLMHVYLNDQETRIWDRKISWWTPWVSFNPDLDQKARLAALAAVQAAALEMGLLREAQTNTERTIRRFLALAGIDAVEFAHPAANLANPPARRPAP